MFAERWGHEGRPAARGDSSSSSASAIAASGVSEAPSAMSRASSSGARASRRSAVRRSCVAVSVTSRANPCRCKRSIGVAFERGCAGTVAAQGERRAPGARSRWRRGHGPARARHKSRSPREPPPQRQEDRPPRRESPRGCEQNAEQVFIGTGDATPEACRRTISIARCV